MLQLGLAGCLTTTCRIGQKQFEVGLTWGVSQTRYGRPRTSGGAWSLQYGQTSRGNSMHTHASCHEYVLNSIRSFRVLLLLPVDITVIFAKIDPYPGAAQTRSFYPRVGSTRPIDWTDYPIEKSYVVRRDEQSIKNKLTDTHPDLLTPCQVPG